jgi:hypothetical protein
MPATLRIDPGWCETRAPRAQMREARRDMSRKTSFWVLAVLGIIAQPVLTACLIDEAGRAVEDVGDEIEETGERVEDVVK